MLAAEGRAVAVECNEQEGHGPSTETGVPCGAHYLLGRPMLGPRDSDLQPAAALTDGQPYGHKTGFIREPEGPQFDVGQERSRIA
jgi:hypothetical protein